MTEKRFKPIIDGVEDILTGDKLNNQFEVCLKLNELHNENEILIQGVLMKEEIINDLKDDIKKCNIQCRKLGNENEQLKITNKSLLRCIDNIHKETLGILK